MDATAVQATVHEIVNQLSFTKVQTQQPLLSTQVLDSIGVVDLIVKLEEKFGVHFDLQHVNETRFDTVEQITNEVVNKLKGN